MGPIRLAWIDWGRRGIGATSSHPGAYIVNGYPQRTGASTG